MLGLGSNLTKGGAGAKTIVTDSLVLKHNYAVGAVQPLSSGAASFNGTSDYIDCGDLGAAKSLAFWFKTSTNITSSTAYQRVFGFSSSYYGVNLGASTGSISGEVLTVLPDNSNRTGTTTTFDSNTWYHACISWNASSNYFDIYINGVLSTDLSTGTHTLADWDSFIIGTDNGTGTHFGGYICNVGVWSATLDQAQVKSIMNKNYDSLSASEKTDLVSWWNLDSVIPDTTTLVYDNHHGGGEVLGAEEVEDGNFPSGTTDWSEGTGWSLVDGYANASSASGELSQSGIDFDTSKTYYIEYTISGYSGSGGVQARFKGLAWNTGVLREENGTFTEILTCTAENTVFTFVTSSSFTGSISNVSVKLINGNTGTLS
jgi:hypothetical protein